MLVSHIRRMVDKRKWRKLNKHNYTVFDAVSDVTNNAYNVGYISTNDADMKEKLIEHLNENSEIWSDFYGKNYSVFNVNNELNEESLDDFLDKIDVDKRTVLVSKEKQCYDEERWKHDKE